VARPFGARLEPTTHVGLYVDARGSTFNLVGRDQVNVYIHVDVNVDDQRHESQPDMIVVIVATVILTLLFV
jgi:hypothetical protein